MNRHHRKIPAAILSTALAVLLSPGPAAGGDEFSLRRKEQRERIETGRRMGRITNREYIHLRDEQWRIRVATERAKSDGRIDRLERSELRRMQQGASRHIFRSGRNEHRSPHRRRDLRRNRPGHGSDPVDRSSPFRYHPRRR